MRARALLEQFGDSAESGRAAFTQIVLDIVSKNLRARNSADTAANLIARQFHLPKDLTFELLLSVWRQVHETLKEREGVDIRIVYSHISLITGLTEKGIAWMRDNVVQGNEVFTYQAEDGIPCETRYAHDIAAGARATGLTVEEI